MEGMIEVTGIDLVKAVQEAYALSSPQGLGHLHFEEGGLTEDEAKQRVRENGRFAISLDYVKGRACKFTVYRSTDDKLFINRSWYDHSDAQLQELLSRLGVANTVETANAA